MYTTSETWDAIVAGEHWFETRVWITGPGYINQSKILDMEIEWNLFSENGPSVGGTMSGELTLSLLKPSQEIPRMAAIWVYVRATNGTDTSEWIQQGVFYVDTREITQNDDGLDIISFHAYDAMLKAEADYPSTTHSWPYSDINVVKEIAYAMGLQSSASATSGVDARTRGLMNAGYQIGLPAGYSMREVLGNIGAMYGGNWIMTYDNKLMLVPLASIPVETNYLADSNGNWLTFGGDRILV